MDNRVACLIENNVKSDWRETQKSRLSCVDSTNSEVEEPGFGDGADLLDRPQD